MIRTSACIAICSLFLLVVSTARAQVSTRDSLALVDFYNSTAGNNWVYHTNWLTTAPIASWDGIVVGKGRVTGIYLQQNNIQGRIPNSFGNMDSLSSLYLSDNNLSGGLPSSFTNLTHLVYLVLQGNPNLGAKLTPAFGNLVNLLTVQMGVTGTKGSLPAEIGKLTKLVTLDFNTCNLTGSLPSSLGRMLQLQNINLSGNSLTGSFPAAAATLPNLFNLDLSHNHFNGTFPAAGNYPQLFNLTLSNNEFSGSLPGWFSKCPQLYTIDVSNNQFTGTIPDELQNAPSLYALTLSYNHFSGPIPSWVFNKYFLFDVFLDHNDFSRADNPCIQPGSTTDYINISYNRYTFNGLECINADNFFYIIAPQASISIHPYQKGLAISAGGTLSNNTYRWFKVGTTGSRIIKGDSTFYPSQSGSYYAKVTNSSVPTLTLTTDTFVYTKPSLTSILSIAVYPNPARGIIQVSGLNAGSDAKITVADLTGYVWMETASHQQPVVKMDVSRLKSGSYLLTVNDGKEVKTTTFMKE